MNSPSKSKKRSSEPVRARIPTLHKMVELCGRFTPEQPRRRLQDLSEELGWDGATTHRFLKALVEIRMLDAHEDGSYAIGMLPVELAAVHLGSEPRRRDLIKRCEEIAERTGLTSQLGVLDGNRIVVIASQEGRSALKAEAMLGQRLPLHATAGGKAILSQLDEEEIAALLPERLEQFAEDTVTTRAELIEEVRLARADGLARARSELAPGLHAIGVALPAGEFDTGPAALMCAGPVEPGRPEQWQLAESLLREVSPSAGFGAAGDGAGPARSQASGLVAGESADAHKGKSGGGAVVPPTGKEEEWQR